MIRFAGCEIAKDMLLSLQAQHIQDQCRYAPAMSWLHTAATSSNHNVIITMALFLHMFI